MMTPTLILAVALVLSSLHLSLGENLGVCNYSEGEATPHNPNVNCDACDFGDGTTAACTVNYGEDLAFADMEECPDAQFIRCRVTVNGAGVTDHCCNAEMDATAPTPTADTEWECLNDGSCQSVTEDVDISNDLLYEVCGTQYASAEIGGPSSLVQYTINNVADMEACIGNCDFYPRVEVKAAVWDPASLTCECARGSKVTTGTKMVVPLCKCMAEWEGECSDHSDCCTNMYCTSMHMLSEDAGYDWACLSPAEEVEVDCAAIGESCTSTDDCCPGTSMYSTVQCTLDFECAT